MKKFYYLSLMLVILLSCSKTETDSEDSLGNSNIEELILGRWYLKSETIDGVVHIYDGSSNDESCPNVDDKYIFFNNDAMYMRYGGDCGDSLTDYETFNILDDIITVTSEYGGSFQMTVLTLNQDVLIVDYNSMDYSREYKR